MLAPGFPRRFHVGVDDLIALCLELSYVQRSLEVIANANFVRDHERFPGVSSVELAVPLLLFIDAAEPLLVCIRHFVFCLALDAVDASLVHVVSGSLRLQPSQNRIRLVYLAAFVVALLPMLLIVSKLRCVTCLPQKLLELALVGVDHLEAARKEGIAAVWNVHLELWAVVPKLVAVERVRPASLEVGHLDFQRWTVVRESQVVLSLEN